MTSLPRHGELRETPLPRILLAIYRSRFQGMLELEREHIRKRFVFGEGAPALSESNRPGETLPALLCERGLIDTQARTRLEAHVARTGCTEAAGLLALELLDSQALFRALREQLRCRLLECMGWPGGAFRLSAGAGAPPQAQAFRCDPYLLVQEGLATHWDPERLLTDLIDKLELIPEPAAGLPAVARRLHRDPPLDRALATLAGRAPLAQVIGVASSSPQALAALWLLDASELLSYRSADVPSDAAAPTDGASGDAVDEIVVEVVATRAGASERAAEPQKPTASDAGAAPAAAAVEMAEEVREMRERLEDLNHFEVLGLTRDVASAGVRRAYFVAAKRYHPDALNRLGLDAETRARAGEVFARIAQANEVLSDDDKRREYEAWLDDDQRDVDVNRLAMAEKSFRKGEILVGMGNFRGALEFLEQAVALWPEEAAYQSMLGWACFRMTPPALERARTHLERAIALDPSDLEAQSRLEMVRETAGAAPPHSG